MKSTNANDGTLDAQGLVRGRVESRHGQRAHAEPRVAGHAADAAVGEELRRHRQEGARVSAARDLGQVAEGHLRQQLSVQLHDDQHQRRDRAHLGRRADQPVRRQRLRDARVAPARSDRAPRAHRPGHRQRDQPAEPADAGGSDWRTAGGGRHRVHLHGPHAGAPARRGSVRQHHPAHQSGRLGGPAEGRRPARARDDALQRRRPPRRQALRRHRRVPDPGHERARRREHASRPRWPIWRRGFLGTWTTWFRSTRRCPSRKASTRSSTRCSRRSSSSSSSCSSSCRTGARR